MNLENWQFYAFMIGQIVLIVGAYKDQVRKAEATYQKLSAALETSHAKLSSELALAVLTEKTDRAAGQTDVKNDMMLRINKVDSMVEDISHRVTKLEGGQDEWTKALRERTHELAGHMQALALKVDRLERPGKQETA